MDATYRDIVLRPMRRRFTRALSFAAALALFVSLRGSAEAQETTSRSPLSAYETETIERALASLGAAVDDAPEGKTLEGVDVVALEVIEDRDPAPGFLNVFHATTTRETIQREVLLAVGAPYRQYRVDETVRVLRSFQQISLVLAVATRGSSPEKVRLVVITKDVWSLRSQFDLRLGERGLDRLRVEPTERNIGGTLNSAMSRFELLPESLTLGAGFFVPRVAGKTVYFVSEANVVVSRATGEPEGTYGSFGVFRPLVSSDTPLVWSYGTTWSNVVVRRYVGARVAAYDDPRTPEIEAAPDAFRARTMTQTAGVLRSFGRGHKADVSFGAELNVRDYVGLDPSRFSPRLVASYAAARVPTSDHRAGPFAQVRLYESRFVRIHDFDVLGLAEDYRVGYDAYLRAYPVTRALGSSRDFVGADAFLQYVWPVRDGFLRATTESIVELAPDGVPVLGVAASGAMVSPRFFPGRIVFDGVVIARPENYLNLRASLGGEGRLRGYPSAAFLGQNMVAWSTELRSRPVEILTAQVGVVAFHDVGDAFDVRFTPKSSVGFGVRTLFPQLDRKVFRFDVAFPLVRGPAQAGLPPTGPVGFYVAFEQAFPSVASLPPGTVASQAILNASGAALGQ